MEMYLEDEAQSWEMQANGEYVERFNLDDQAEGVQTLLLKQLS